MNRVTCRWTSSRVALFDRFGIECRSGFLRFRRFAGATRERSSNRWAYNMKAPWREFIVKETISEFVINQLRDKVPEEHLVTLENLVCKTKADIRQLSKCVKVLKKHLDSDVYEELCDELNEIKEDNNWIGSSRGKYVLAINEWMQPFYEEFRSIPKFDDIFIGGHSEKTVVFVCGKVSTHEDYDLLLDFITKKKPPFKVLADVMIEKSAQHNAPEDSV